MKKIINTPETFVIEMCKGMIKAHPELDFIEKYKIVKRRELTPGKVTLISGGGSGHEPAHGGFVGTGMLDAAVCGDIFASPSQTQVYQGLKAVASPAGTLMVVKNYSGDCMNFNNAASDAKEDGLLVDAVYVNDDIAVKDSLYTVGRRGVAGTVYVHKIAGAKAEEGASLPEVKRVAQKVIDNVRSFGFAFTSCTVPAKGTPTFDIGADEMEFGVGIHGEPGRRREKLQSSDVLADTIVKDLIEDLKLKKGEEVALLINGFGGTPLQELYLFNNSVSNELEKNKIKIYDTLVGNFMTSIDMAGASVSVLRLDDELKLLLDAPVSTPALRKGSSSKEATDALAAVKAVAKALASAGLGTLSPAAVVADGATVAAKAVSAVDKASFAVKGKAKVGETINTAAFVKWIDYMADVIIENEVHFCEMDSVAGDGDFGMSIAKGFKQLKADWDTRVKTDIGAFLKSSGEIIKEYCGGASGPIWGSAFRGAGKAAEGKEEITLKDLGDILAAALKAVQDTGERSFGRGAVVGDKTLVDALAPTAEALASSAKAGEKLLIGLKKGAEAAVAGAEYTKSIAARMGRAGTVGERSIGYPDAGAYGLGVIFTQMANQLSKIK
ncbi:MAG: dihydroxyacetone kinase subunit DhaK [Christensenellaceae bacterium]|jgi:dihydroxyacetone kinase|nr:dihydroxyacetone kinase subunit DhaK [Christensenellaceae bacterium]